MRPTQPSGGLAASADLKFLQNVVQVILDGGGANRELARDFLIGAALLDERQDFGLTRRQGQQRLLLVGPVQLAGKAGEHRGCNIRRAVHAAFDCVQQGAVKCVRTADIAAEAGGGAGKDLVVGLVECKRYQPGAAAERCHAGPGRRRKPLQHQHGSVGWRPGHL